MPVDDSSSGAVSAGGGISTVRLGDVAQLRPGLLTLPPPLRRSLLRVATPRTPASRAFSGQEPSFPRSLNDRHGEDLRSARRVMDAIGVRLRIRIGEGVPAPDDVKTAISGTAPECSSLWKRLPMQRAPSTAAP